MTKWVLLILFLLSLSIVSATLFILPIDEISSNFEITKCAHEEVVHKVNGDVIDVLVDREICSDEPENKTCEIKPISQKSWKTINESYVVCRDAEEVKLTFAGTEKKISYDNKGCFQKGDLLTCATDIDGYSPYRSPAFTHLCRSGETCKQWNITTGKELYDGDPKDEISI